MGDRIPGVTVVSFMTSLMTFLGVIALSSARSTGSRDCHLINIPLQENFDLKRFEGRWHGVLKTGIKDSMLSYFTEIYDGRIMFKHNAEGGFDLRAAGSKFYGGWCPRGKGVAAVKDPGSPQKMVMYFDTRIGRKIGMKPAWLLKTDYDNYAVIYSCWKELSTGTCDPDSTYAFVVQRNTQPMDAGHKKDVIQALESACVDIKNLSPIKHYGYCIGEDGM